MRLGPCRVRRLVGDRDGRITTSSLIKKLANSFISGRHVVMQRPFGWPLSARRKACDGREDLGCRHDREPDGGSMVSRPTSGSPASLGEPGCADPFPRPRKRWFRRRASAAAEPCSRIAAAAGPGDARSRDPKGGARANTDSKKHLRRRSLRRGRFVTEIVGEEFNVCRVMRAYSLVVQRGAKP